MPAYGHINLLRRHWINEEAAISAQDFLEGVFLLPSNPFWEKRRIECDNIVYMICDFTMLCYVSTNFWCTKNCRKKHDMVHQEPQKKNTIWCTKNGKQEHVHEEINKTCHGYHGCCRKCQTTYITVFCFKWCYKS